MAYYYGDLNNYSNVEKLQKRAFGLGTGNHYIAHTEPLFKLYYKLNVKFYYNLCCNRLPQYFSVYHHQDERSGCQLSSICGSKSS